MLKEISEIINKYSELYKKQFKEEIILESALENFNTLTRLSGKDIFQNNKNQIKFEDFEKTIILFTDLKNSTNILKKCENNNILIYIAYMHYSTMLLAEILNLFNGNLIESTGDGTYSIIPNNQMSMNNAIDDIVIKNGSMIRTNSEVLKYYSIFDIHEMNYIFEENSSKINSFPYPERIRTLFFLIFAIFNTNINEISQLKKLDIKFLTRIGCKIGSCKVTRLEIYQHISQDKLIGSIVHEAAHQASGK